MSAVYAVRLPDGKLHIARAVRGGYDAACWRTLTGRNLVVYEAAPRRRGEPSADDAWRHEPRCLDCQSLRKRGLRELIRVAGW